MYCTNCNTQLPEEALFCLNCGAEQPKKPTLETGGPETPAQQKLRRGIAFLDNWLAFVAIGVLATVTMILFAVGSRGFAVWDVTAAMRQFCLVGALGMAALASTRTGGLDLSVGGMMALSALIFAMMASGNNAGAGALLSLVVCVALGLLNGMFIMVARLPAVLVTVASAMLTRGIALWGSGGASVRLPAEWAGMSAAASIAALLVSVGVAVALLWLAGGKEKKTLRGEKKLFWIYGLVAAVGVLAGWAAAICLGAADVGIGAGSSNEMVLLFVFAFISASALLKNNWLALVWVLAAAMLWTIHDQAMILLELNPYSWIVSNASWVFIMLAVMTIAKRGWKKPVNAQ